MFQLLWLRRILHDFIIGSICVLTEPAASTLCLERQDIWVQVSCEGPISVVHGLGRGVLVTLILTRLKLVLEACVSLGREVRPVAAQK